jgi:hypothetical protein
MKIFIDLKQKMIDVINQLPNNIVKITHDRLGVKDEYFFKKNTINVNNFHIDGELIACYQDGEINETPCIILNLHLIELFTNENVDITSITDEEFSLIKLKYDMV